MSATPSPWTAPGFRRLAVGWVFSNLGDSALYLMTAVWVKDLTGSDAAAAFVFVCLGIPALAAPFLGMLADRVSRKALLALSHVAIVPVVLTLLFLTDAGQVWIAYAVILVYASFGYLTAAAQSGIVRAMLRDEQLAGGNGILSTIDNALRLLSPLLGTALYVLVGPSAVVLVTAGCFAVAALVFAGLPVGGKPAPDAETETPGGYLRELVAGFTHLVRTPALRWSTVAIAIAFGATGLLNVLVFPLLDMMGAPASALGWLNPLQGVGAVIGGVLSAWVIGRLGEARTAALGLAVMAAGAAPLVTGLLPLAAVGLALVGGGVTLTAVAFMTLRQRLTPDALQGRAAAATNVAFNVPQTVVSVAAASLLLASDPRLLVAVSVAAVLIGAALALTAHSRAGAASAPAPAPAPADVGAGAA